MEVEPEQLVEATSLCRGALEPFAARDWSVQAGDLAWDVRRTVSHVSDALGWYAAHLALQSLRRLRFDFLAHREASNAQLLDVLDAAAATLGQVASAAPAGARAYHNAGLADTCGFLAMGCDEVLVHCWDMVRGLGGEFAAPTHLAEPLLRRLFPWAPTDAPAWPALLWANGRADLPGHTERPGPDWRWHCAPLGEWDGTVPHDTGNPPGWYEWDEAARRWNPCW
jgi:hypothetical protein